jgi:hemerythrin-like domain-containing protein
MDLMPRHPSLMPLSHDHHHGLALALRCRKQALGQVKPMGVPGLRERAREIKEFFSTNLEKHFQAEEKALFPFMCLSIPQSRTLIDGLLEDHKKMREAARGLEVGTDVAKLLFDFGDLLERHIRREERELFLLFEEHATQEEAERVKREIEKILERGEDDRL